MELKKLKEFLSKKLKKDKWVKLAMGAGICGVLLIYLSTLSFPQSEAETEKKSEEISSPDYKQQLEADLLRIVRAMTGEENAEVMVTFENTGEYIYAADEKSSYREDNSEERESTHIFLEDSEGTQQPLTVTEIQPEVKGVVIVCASAENPAVKEKLTNAVQTALNIPSSRVCVTDSG